MAKLEQARYRCEQCPSRQRLEVHHLKYNPYNERLSDLKVLCENCHEQVHMLEKTGGKIAIIQSEPEMPAKPRKAKTKQITLQNLLNGNRQLTEESILEQTSKMPEKTLRTLFLESRVQAVRRAAFKEIERRKTT